MSDFTASNGYKVSRLADGQTKIVTGSHGAHESVVWCSSEEYRAIAEHAQHERDKELGRWRDPENSNVWVKPAPTTYVLDAYHSRGLREDVAVAVNEATCARADYQRGHRATGGLADSITRYFAAHPEPKPWHDAKPGELWVVTTEYVGKEFAVRVADLNETIVFEYVKGLAKIPVTDTRIVTGRRIWPEVTS